MIKCLLVYRKKKLVFKNQSQLAKFLHPHSLGYNARRSHRLSMSDILESTSFIAVRSNDPKYEELSKLPDIEVSKEFELWIAYKSTYKSKITLEEFTRILRLK